MRRNVLISAVALLMLANAWTLGAAQDLPDAPEVPEVPTAPECAPSEPPAAPDAPAVPDVPPDVPDAPDAPDAPCQDEVDDAVGEASDAADAVLRDALLSTPIIVWTNKNMGPDSGMDADTLDGDHAAVFHSADAALRAAIAAEEAARAAGDAALSGQIAGERAQRISADNNLQSQINALQNGGGGSTSASVFELTGVSGRGNGRIHSGNVGDFGAAGRDPDYFDGGSHGMIIECCSSDESAGIFMNGNTMVMWSPGDRDILRVYDEDQMHNGYHGDPSEARFRIDNSGSIYAYNHVYAHRSSHIGDVAEPIVGDVQPGMVVVMDGFDAETGKLKTAPATQPYSTKVIGIVSTNPSVHLAGDETDTPMAVSGIVPVKVVGPVAEGDLLTSSAVAGHAQACRDVMVCFGVTVAKALEAHDGVGTGEVLAMVTLS